MIGCHVDEALSRAEKFLDEALVAELRSVRLIHGYGTGQLRRAIAEFLHDAPARRELRIRPARTGRRRRHRRGVEGIGWRSFLANFIEDLKSHADIVQVVQERVPLRRSGATWKGLCPFHGEKTPSFHVNGDKGFFHCFGCGVGGDVIKFVELHDKITFPEAVRQLAARGGHAGAGAGRREAGRREPRASARRC